MTSDRTVSSALVARLLGEWQDGGTSYRRLADRLDLLVVDGRIVPDARLPAERDLATRLGVSRTVVTGAYAALRERGVIDSRRGSGSVVRRGVRPAAARPTAVAAADLSNATPLGWDRLPEHAERAAARLREVLPAHGIDFTGLPELRARIAERYGARGVPTVPSQILVTVGAQHAIGLVLRALVARGDRIAVDVPSYPHALDAFRDAGARVVPIAMPDLEPDLDRWESVLASLRPTAAYLMPDFHNPTGSSLTDDGRRRLLAAAARSGTLLVADETTAELDIDRPGTCTPLAGLAAGTGAGVISLGSVSKTVWHGLRIGWIRAEAHLVDAIAARRPAGDLGTPVLDQLVVSELLPGFAGLLDERRASLRRTRDAVVARLRETFPDWAVPSPRGGLCVWLALPAPVSSSLTQAALTEGLSITAGPRFGVDGAFERYLRVPITASPESTEAAIEVLARAWARVRQVPLPDPHGFTPVL